jgi:hypothetical protein
MANEQSCVYVTHDHIQPLKEQLKEHAGRFQAIDGWKSGVDEWKGGVDRRVNGFEKSLTKICETLSATESKVTTRQDALSGQQIELTRKFDDMAADTSKSEVRIDGIAKTLEAMALADAEERGRKIERDLNEAEKRASFTRKAVLIGSIYTMLQIIVIAINYLKH